MLFSYIFHFFIFFVILFGMSPTFFVAFVLNNF